MKVPARQSVVTIEDQDFCLNGQATYQGVFHQGCRIEGLLLNSRMVQGVFDDANAATRHLWDYPDGPWDPNRNTQEFIQNMPKWKAYGLNAITLNLQGGSPYGYSREQPWINSAFTTKGELKSRYLHRLTLILDQADELGLVVILGLFYFGQFARFESEFHVVQAVDNTVDWILAQGYTNILIEIGNEVDITRTPYGYGSSIVSVSRCHELIQRVQLRSAGKLASPVGRLLASTSLKGGAVPAGNLLQQADFLLLHGNGVEEPGRIAEMVRECRQAGGYQGQPVLFNEDDHYRFQDSWNNMRAALQEHAGWGFFDYRREGEGWHEGFQSVPVDWDISSSRKRAFFDLLAEVTGRDQSQQSGNT